MNLKSKMKSGKNVLGPLVGPGNDPETTVRTVKDWGCDFLMMDLEHCLIDKETVYAYVLQAHEMDIPLLMRPDEKTSHFRAYLDSGVNGLMAPHLDTVEEAVYLVNQSYFPPIGHRGSGMSKYILDFQSPAEIPYLELAEYVNNNTVVFSMTEGLENIGNLHRILDLEGITGTIVGTFDLAWEVGHIDPKAMMPDVITTPAMEETLKQIVKICKEKKKVAGIGGLQTKALPKWAKEGYQLFILGRVSDGEADRLRPLIEEAKALVG
jgi:2-keto-3-deoxy-L-rhamnonate aldolase RhmA